MLSGHSEPSTAAAIPFGLAADNAFGRDYIVWDKAGEIEFVKPGRGTVHARFDLDMAVLDELRSATAGGDKTLRWFETKVVDAEGEVVARVRKQLYVRRKPQPRIDR